MAIKVGDKIPSVTLRVIKDGSSQPVSTDELFAGKKVALFAVPGAFTPTCSAKHLPSYIENAGSLKAKGIDAVACVAVNDPFVMRAWGESSNAGDKVVMIADGNAEFARALGLDADMARNGMGVRSRRYSMVVDNGVVKQLNVEEPGAYSVSSAEHLLNQL